MESSSLKQLSVLMATVFVDMIGFLMVLPTIPYYAKDLGARPVVITMIISSFFFAQLVTAPLWGRFSDRYRRRPVLQSVLAVLLHPWAPASSLIWIYTIGMMAFMAMNGVLALFLRAQYGVTVTTIGYFFMYIGAIGFIMRALLLGRLVRRFGE